MRKIAVLFFVAGCGVEAMPEPMETVRTEMPPDMAPIPEAPGCQGPRTLIFPAPVPLTVGAVDAGTVVRLQTHEGKPVVALHFAAPAGAPTLVMFHGNAEQLSSEVAFAQRLAKEGLGVFAVEYPGYGEMEGWGPSEATVYEAAEVALAHLTGPLGVPTSSIVFQGYSLGSGPATEMALRKLGHKLVLLAPFTSIEEMSKDLRPFLPEEWILCDFFDNQAKAPKITAPVLIVHGSADTTVPQMMGRTLATLFPQVESEWIMGAGHGDMFVKMPQLYTRIADFARK